MNKLFLLLFAVFLMSSVSAFDLKIDNAKTYDSLTKTAIIENTFGLGSEVARVKLDTPQVNYILALGYQKVFQFTINSKEIYNNPIESIVTYDKDSKGNLIKREQKIDLFYLKDGEWLILPKEIPEGEILVAGFTDVKAGDYVEWIPTMFGVEINEWAIYAADPYLKSYWKFDEATGSTAFDSVSGNNLSLGTGVTWNSTGKINYDLNYSGTGGTAMSFLPFTGTQNFSLFGWIKTSDNGNVQGIISFGSTATLNQGLQLYKGADNLLHFDLKNTAGPTGSGAINNGAWRFVGVVWNGTHIQMYLDGIVNGSPTSMSPNIQAGSQFIGALTTGTSYWRGGLDEWGIWNRTLNQTEINQLYNSGNGLQYPFTVITQVNLTNPSNSASFSSLVGQTFNSSASISNMGTVVNATRYLWYSNGTFISTNFTTYVPNNKTNFTIPSLPEGNYLWNIENCGSDSACMFGTINYSFAYDNTLPSVRLVTPSNATYIYSLNSTKASFNLNVSASDNNLDKVWYNSSFNSTNTFVTNNALVQLNTSNLFGLQNIYACANDTVNNVFCNQSSIYIHKNYFANTAYETESQNYSLELWNVTAPDIYVLNYNGTNYTGTLTNVGNNKYTLNNTIDVPTGDSTKGFFYYLNDTQFRTSTLLNQTVNYATLGICNATLTTPFLNISFKNETVGQEVVNASIQSAEFNYYIGSGTIVKNYSFVSTSENRSYTLCFSPITANITISESIDYLNSVSPQREYNTITNAGNTTKQQTLYLLPSLVGQYVTFQIINPALQPISNVTVNVSSGSFGLLETKTTDASGAVTFFLNPLVTYTIIASKTGLTTYETSITPTQTEYTLTMGAGTTETSIDDYFRGIDYTINPTQVYLANSTTYTFNFTISSDYWNLDRFGITLTNSTGSLFGSNSSTSSSGGTVSLTRNTGDNSTLILKPYWIIDGNTTNISKIYIVYDSSGSDTSLANLRDRIRIYIDSGGFFGLTAFGLNILVFLCIFITTGIISYKFGFTSPFAVFGIMLVLTMMFDQVNFITYADSLPEDAATILVAILTLAFGIKEATN